MSGLSAAVLGVTLVAATWSLTRRIARTGAGAHPVEAAALGSATALAVLGIAASLLGLFGIFDATSMTLSAATLGVVAWPSPAGAAPIRVTGQWRSAALMLLILVGGVALRLPPTDASLAGRDQGSYALRARALARTGRHSLVDRHLREAAASEATASGPADILGLHPKRGESWRAGRYEAAYRPGWYISNRDAGRVVPQFLHLHPSSLAVAHLVFGDHAVAAGVVLNTSVLLLLMLAVGRRCFAHPGLAWLPMLLLALSPLAIWVHRTPLSENPSSILLWGAVLSALRTRDHDPQDLDRAALLLGAMTWVRGNAWLAAPVMLATLWLVPGHAPRRRRPVLILLGVSLGAVLVHANSVYPYLVDEFAKQLWRGPMPTGSAMASIALFGAGTWWLVDATSFHRRADSAVLAAVRRAWPWALGTLTALAVLSYIWLDAVGPDVPYARLQAGVPTFGIPLLVLAGVGVFALSARGKLQRARDVWLAAIAGSVVVNILLYAQRNLPHAGLFYYGRYLAPDLLPAAGILATTSLALVHRRLRRIGGRARTLAPWLTAAVSVATLGWIAHPLATQTIVRLPEFEGSGRIVDAIAARTGPQATVIAGGEGWHAGHTFNQVGGALALGHGIDVLPYRSKEAFYAAAYELLVARPRRSGEKAPPVFLLLAEATHHTTNGRGQSLAAVDDLLPPPLVATSAEGFELFSNRLTPSVGELPARVTRDQLRMVLFEIGVDETAEQPSLLWDGERWAQRSGWSPPLQPRCLPRDGSVHVSLPPAMSGPGSLAIVMAPRTARVQPSIELEVDGEHRLACNEGGRARPCDTLGPFFVDGDRHELRLWAHDRANADAACPWGGIAEIRWLGLERSATLWTGLEATSFPPPQHFRDPAAVHRWVRGRGLSKRRGFFDPQPTAEGLSMVLDPAQAIHLAPIPLPHHEAGFDVVVTLTAVETGPGARLQLLDGETSIADIELPARQRRLWRSEAVAWSPHAPSARLTLVLDSSRGDDRVLVRDIGLFSRDPPLDAEGRRVH